MIVYFGLYCQRATPAPGRSWAFHETANLANQQNTRRYTIDQVYNTNEYKNIHHTPQFDYHIPA
jgi:hypothetical protein